MIHYINENLLESDCNLIVHGCNCFNTMGSGIARQLREKWPEVYEADCATISGDMGKAGSFSLAKVAKGKVVVNLYTQYFYGQDRKYLDYYFIERGFKKVQEEIVDKFPGLKLGMPKIGCGLAGGDWDVVEKIIDRIFDETYVYEYSP